jgi:hypothetical protein
MHFINPLQDMIVRDEQTQRPGNTQLFLPTFLLAYHNQASMLEVNLQNR